MESSSLAVVAGSAVVFGLFFTWLGRRLAPRLGLIDRPDGRRKIHSAPVAVVGGLAILLAATATILFSSLVSPAVLDEVRGDLGPVLALLAAAAVIAFVGMVDDVVNLRARYKLLGQFTAIAILLVPGGYAIEQVTLFGEHISLGWLSLPVTALWFLAAINALNLLDGMDGMLGTIGTITFASLAVMAFSVSKPIDGYLAVAMAGALIGFLRYNLPPASVYLGDCGSMLVGLCIAALAIHASIKGPAVAVVAPTALLALPFLDTAAAIVRRKLTGRGIAHADRGHLHHMLQKRGLPASRALALVSALCIVAALGALASLYLRADFAAVAAALAIGLILVAGGLFGSAELRLIRERLRSLFQRAAGGGIQMEVRLQGTTDWTDVWRGITETAEEFRFAAVTLDLNAPAWHEGYHRRWSRVGVAEDPLTQWRVELPLYTHGQIIGRLSVVGHRDTDGLDGTMLALARILARTEQVAGAAAIRSGSGRAVVHASVTSLPAFSTGA